MANGQDPETIGLRDWLDAGYVMLVEGADATARSLLDELFASSSEEELQRNFTDLRSELSYRQEQARKAEAQQRKTTGGPTHYRRVSEDVLAAAVAEWDAIPRHPDAPGQTSAGADV